MAAAGRQEKREGRKTEGEEKKTETGRGEAATVVDVALIELLG
jgi:hypothetical protein